MKTTYGSLRDQESVEREIALLFSEMSELGIINTTLTPLQLSKLILLYYEGLGDNQIACLFGGEQLSRTVGRARIRLKLFRDFDFHIPFSKEKMNQ